MSETVKEVVRCQKRAAVLFATLLWNPLLIAVYLVGAALWAMIYVPSPPEKLIVLPHLVLAWIVLKLLTVDYQWVEIEGDTIRAQVFWSRRHVCWSIDQIEAVCPLVRRHANRADSMDDAIVGVEIRFQDDRQSFTLMWEEFTSVPDFCRVLLQRIQPAS